MKHLPNICISVIPHKKQRYETCGDYWEANGFTQFRISKTTSDYEFMILIHELIEWYLCKKHKVSLKKIDDFDVKYERDRKEGDTSEPGDNISAPYFNEHQTATIIERALAAALGVNWQEYEKHINSL